MGVLSDQAFPPRLLPSHKGLQKQGQLYVGMRMFAATSLTTINSYLFDK